MGRHFVGNVYVFHDPPEQELPYVDFPTLTQPAEITDELLVQMERNDLGPEAADRMAKFYDQAVLPMDVIRANSTIPPEQQLELARDIEADSVAASQQLVWEGAFPTYAQLEFVCKTIWHYFVASNRRQGGVSSGRQLANRINSHRMANSVSELIQEQIGSGRFQTTDPDTAVEGVLDFRRTWLVHRFPKLLMAIQRIQESVLSRLDLPYGDFTAFATSCECQFVHPNVAALEEYGIPSSFGNQLHALTGRNDDFDTFLAAIKRVDPMRAGFRPFFTEVLVDLQKTL